MKFYIILAEDKLLHLLQSCVNALNASFRPIATFDGAESMSLSCSKTLGMLSIYRLCKPGSCERAIENEQDLLSKIAIWRGAFC